jgi:hypothetical protein
MKLSNTCAPSIRTVVRPLLRASAMWIHRVAPGGATVAVASVRETPPIRDRSCALPVADTVISW